MSGQGHARKTMKLDEPTRAALEEGLRLAEANQSRWTAEEVRADVKKMAREWRKKVTKKASA